MLSKMAKPVYRKLRLVPIQDKHFGKVTTMWKRILSTGREVMIAVTSSISKGVAYVNVEEQQFSELIEAASKSDPIILDMYNGVFDSYRYGPLTVECINHNNLNPDESKEVYRSIYKWDLILREKSSDSDSDSESNQEKINRHQWICCGETHHLVGGFRISI